MVTPFTRREFLAASSVAVAGPIVLGKPAFAGVRRGPGTIGIGFIGCGKRMFELLGPFLGRGEVQVLAVCDVDTTRRDAAKKQVDGHYAKAATKPAECRAFNDYKDLLAMPGVDAVVISTPDHWHASQVVDAAKAGKDIYCEKPLSLKIGEAKAMVDAVRKYDRVFQTGSQQRTEFGGLFRKGCEYVRSGRVGQVMSVNVGVGESSVPCDLPEEAMEAGLDWDRWLGPAPKRPYNSILSPRGVHTHYPNWRLYWEYSGGMMTDFGAHHYDIAQWALQMDGSGPVEVHPPRDPKAKYGAYFVYPNGVVMVHGGPFGSTYVGRDGVLFVTRDRLDTIPPEILQKPLTDKDVHLPAPPDHISDWIACIGSRQRCICDVEVGARSVTICHLANLAYWHRRALKWDPQKWEFPGDSEANGWMDYKRREGYELPKV